MKFSSLILPALAFAFTSEVLAQLQLDSAQSQSTNKSAASAPENHPEAYRQFKAALELQAKENSMDSCPAIMIAIQATGDEFSVEQWMEQAAKENNPVALCFVATKHLNLVLSKDKMTDKTKKNVAMIKKAADMKYTPAMVDYSIYLRNGVGVFTNTAAADRTLMEACRSGSFETRYSWLRQTKRLEKFEDQTRPEVEVEIKRGNHYVIHHLSSKAPSSYVVYNMLTTAARLGNPYAMYELSRHLSRNNLHAASYHYLKAAAEHHNPEALSTLGHYLLDPNEKIAEILGTQKNEAAGIELLKISAILGDSTARFHMGRLYYHGLHGVEQDKTKAYKHIEEGLTMRPNDVGFMTAQGFMLANGDGVEKDEKRGVELIQTAAKAGYPYAMAIRAYMNFRGLGLQANGKEAAFELENLATAGFDICFVYLALIYDEGGAGLEKDERKVRYYLDHAKRRLGERAETAFNDMKTKHGKWVLTPFEISNN